MPRKPPTRGDLVKITWLDIIEDPGGDPETCKLAERTSFGLWWADEIRAGRETIITTTTIDRDSSHQSGYCAYPKGCVVGVEVMKRAPK